MCFNALWSFVKCFIRWVQNDKLCASLNHNSSIQNTIESARCGDPKMGSSISKVLIIISGYAKIVYNHFEVHLGNCYVAGTSNLITIGSHSQCVIIACFKDIDSDINVN